MALLGNDYGGHQHDWRSLVRRTIWIVEETHENP